MVTETLGIFGAEKACKFKCVKFPNVYWAYPNFSLFIKENNFQSCVSTFLGISIGKILFASIFISS